MSISVLGKDIINTISLIRGKFFELPVNGLAVGNKEDTRGFVTSSYSTIPKAFHSPSSLNLG